MKWIVLTFALLFSTAASAQCTGVFQPNTLCGNLGASPAPPSAFSASGTVVGPGSSTIGDVATWANTAGTLLQDGGTLRQRLIGNIALYVNGNAGGTATCGPAGISTCSAGVDTGKCLTPSTACLTLQYAYGLLVGNVDFAYAFSGTIYLAHNAGTTNYQLICVAGPVIGTGVFNVVGDSGSVNATVVQDDISGSPGHTGVGWLVKDGCTVGSQGISWIDSVSANATAHILIGGSGNAGHFDLGAGTLGSLALSGATKIQVGGQGSGGLQGAVTDSGNATAFIQITGPANFTFQNQVVTESGTPAYTEYALLVDGGEVVASSANFSGSATGLRCLVLGAMNTGGIDPNFIFPGNSNCVQNELVGAIGIQNGASFSYGTTGHALLSGGAGSAKDTWDTAGVTCTAGALSAITFTAANGIITHC